MASWVFSVVDRLDEAGVGLLGEHWDRVQTWLGPVTYGVLGLPVVGVAWLAVRRTRARRAEPERNTEAEPAS